MARSQNPQNPNYPYLVYCGACLGSIRHEGKRGQLTRRVCVDCGQDENFVSDIHKNAILDKQKRDGAEVFDSLPPEFQAYYAYTEKGQTTAQLPGQEPEKENG
jgi:hypothetical protein